MNKVNNQKKTGETPSGKSSKPPKRSWRVAVNPGLCKGCNICIEFCPTDVFEKSETLNRKGYYVPLVAHEEECTGCRICDLMCPELAIVIEPKNKSGKTK